MDVRTAYPPQIAPVASPPTSNAPGAVESPAVATSSGPSDNVSLSAEAQRALAVDTAAAPTPASSAEALAKAVSVLNDISGAASLDDQLEAFRVIADSLRTGPAASGQPTADLQAGAALIDSPIAQRMQQLLAYVSSHFDYAAWSDGARHANSLDTALAAFDSLSADDQALYVGARALQQHLYKPESVLNETVDDYRVNQVARSGIERALQVAIEDPRYAADTIWNGTGGRNDFYSRRDALGKLAEAAGDQQMVDLVKLSQTSPETLTWTQTAQAYFAKYGPPPAGEPTKVAPPSTFVAAPPVASDKGKAVMGAIAAMNDDTGRVSSAEKLSAYQFASSFDARNSGLGPLVGRLIWASPFAKHVDSLDAVMDRGVGRDNDAAQVQLDNLNRMSADDQQIYFAVRSTNDAGGQRFASLDSMKLNFAVRSQFNALRDKIEAKFGASWDLSKVTDPAFIGHPGFDALRDLLRESDPFYDSWTEKAQDVLQQFADFDFGPDIETAATPPDDEGAKALAILRQVSADQRRFVDAERARRMGDEPDRGGHPWRQDRDDVGDRLDTYA